MSALSMNAVARRWMPRPRATRRRKHLSVWQSRGIMTVIAALLSVACLFLSGAPCSEASADAGMPARCAGPSEASRIPGLSSADQGSKAVCKEPADLTRLAALETRTPAAMQQEEEPETRFEPLIARAASQHAVDPALIKAVIMAESGYDPNAVSKMGAKGLMQLMPRTAKALGVKNPLDPEQNILGGVKYLRQLLDTFGGDVTLALAAYNAGRWAVKKHRGVPPFPATRYYVKKVLKYYERFKARAGEAAPDQA